jgi:hypothetical protein
MVTVMVTMPRSTFLVSYVDLYPQKPHSSYLSRLAGIVYKCVFAVIIQGLHLILQQRQISLTKVFDFATASGLRFMIRV